MKNKLLIIDFTTALLILTSLFFIESNPTFWLLYSFACFIYIFVNLRKNLYGQACLNLVAIFIGLKNFFM